VEDALSLGIPGFELLPDVSFHPGNPRRLRQGERGDFNPHYGLSLSTGYVGETSRFPDVRGDSYDYNAIAVSVERGPCPPGVEIAPFWMCTAINSLTNVTDNLGWG
jgi:hypothetical protein